MITVQTADNALKSFYLDAVNNSIDMKANPLLAEIEKTSKDVYGKDVRKVVRFGFNGGIGAGTETGDLPAASTNGHGVFIATLKNLYGTLQISDKALRAAQGGEGAFVDILNDEMQSLIKTSSFNFGRMLYGDGTGKVAKIMTITSEHIVVENTNNLAEGMVIYLCDPEGVYNSSVGPKKIVSIDRAKKTVLLDDMDGVTSNNFGVGSIMSLTIEKDCEITGLEAIFSNSETLYGVDRSTNGMLKPYTYSCSEPTETDIQKAMDIIEESSGSRVNFIVCSGGVKRALAKKLREDNVAMPTMELNSGYKAMSFNGVPIVADRFCPAGTMYLLNTDDFKLHQLCDWEWLEGEDGKVLKQVPGKPVYTATLVKYAELLCERPSGQGKIYDITEA